MTIFTIRFRDPEDGQVITEDYHTKNEAIRMMNQAVWLGFDPIRITKHEEVPYTKPVIMPFTWLEQRTVQTASMAMSVVEAPCGNKSHILTKHWLGYSYDR